MEDLVPGDTISLTDPRQGPATHMVTQDRGRRTSDEGVATVHIDVVVCTGRSPDVAWHVKSEQPEVCCSYGELGTSGEWKGNFENEKVRGHHENACVLELRKNLRVRQGCLEGAMKLMPKKMCEGTT